MFRPHRTQGLRGETYGVVHKGGATTSNDKSLIYACVGVRVCTQVTHAHGAVDTAGDMHAPWDARVHPKPQPLNMPLKTGTAREITSVAPRAHVLSKDTQALTVAIVCHTVCVAWQVGTDGGGGQLRVRLLVTLLLCPLQWYMSISPSWHVSQERAHQWCQQGMWCCKCGYAHM